jgi:tryptophan 2,3-dioxygenase
MVRPEQTLTYESYLRLPELLSLQTPRSSPAAHDELQFIIVHQTYELWFRLMIYEVRAIITFLQTDNVREAIWLLRRLIEIERVMTQQVQILETMSPARFLEFRDLLKPASGLQSFQFRELEFLSGLRDEHFLKLFEEDDKARQRLRETLAGPNVWSAFCDLLRSRGFGVADANQQTEAAIQIYTDPHHLDLHQLCEAMVEYDEQFRVWRARHALMAERMIGAKPGTGAAHTGQLTTHASFQEPGVRYLQGRVGLRFFPVLWEVRTRLGGGSYEG